MWLHASLMLEENERMTSSWNLCLVSMTFESPADVLSSWVEGIIPLCTKDSENSGGGQAVGWPKELRFEILCRTRKMFTTQERRPVVSTAFQPFWLKLCPVSHNLSCFPCHLSAVLGDKDLNTIWEFFQFIFSFSENIRCICASFLPKS